MRSSLSSSVLLVILLVGSIPCSAQLSSLGVFGPGLSPCRQYLAYIADGPTGADVFVQELSTHQRTNVTRSSVNEANPSWSPDSSMIAYNCVQRNGNIDVHIVDLVSGKSTQITDGAGRYLRPFWISDTEVGYTDETTTLSQVIHVALDSGARRELQVGMPGFAGVWQPAALTRPGLVEVTTTGIEPSELHVIRYYTGTLSRMVKVVADHGYRYCPVRERYYQDTSYSPTITWEEGRATGETGTAWTILWSGLFYLPSSQTVTFTMDHDQRIYCWVDGSELYSTTSTDGHAKTVEKRITLSGGIHAIDVAYFDDYEGGGGLSVYWKGETFAWQALRPMAVE